MKSKLLSKRSRLLFLILCIHPSTNSAMECFTCCKTFTGNKSLEDDQEIELVAFTKQEKPEYLLLSAIKKQYRAAMILENGCKEWPSTYSHIQFLIDAKEIAEKSGSVEPLVKAYTLILPMEAQPHVYPEFLTYREKWKKYKLEAFPEVLDMKPIELMLHALRAEMSAAKNINTRYIVEFSQKMNQFYASYCKIHQMPKDEFICERVRTMPPDWELLNFLYSETEKQNRSFPPMVQALQLTPDQWIHFTSLPCDIQCRFCDCVCLPGSPYHYALLKEKFPQTHRRDMLQDILSDLQDSEHTYERKQQHYKETEEQHQETEATLLRLNQELQNMEERLVTKRVKAKYQYARIREDYMQAKEKLTWHALFDNIKDTGDDPEDFT